MNLPVQCASIERAGGRILAFFTAASIAANPTLMGAGSLLLSLEP